jgi:hypothetical protein
MNRLEARIRDALADHLEWLEPGLRLVAAEYPLKNRLGAGGFVDILARDRCDHLVVIEIKRSDQTARSAIHELTKYIALLGADQGLRRDQLRAMLLSTEWNELAVPFSEYLRASDVPTEGFVIYTEETGVITSVSRFDPVNIARPLAISDSQRIVLFSRSVNRDEAIAKVASAATKAGLLDFVLLRLDYHGDDKRVIYRHGVFLLFSRPLEAVSVAEIKAAKRKTGRRNSRKGDEKLLASFLRALGRVGDDHERGSSEKLGVILTTGWHVAVAHRAGRYADNRRILSDEQFIKLATKEEGGAAYFVTRTASPRYAPSWRKLKESSKKVLLGDDRWAIIVPKLLSEIARQRPTATVSVRIYNPANIVFGLAKLFRYGDVGYLPSLQIIVADESESVVYMGMLLWNGPVPPLSAEQWLIEVFGSQLQYMTMQHLRQTYQREEQARRQLGLSSVILEVRHAGGKGEEIVGIGLYEGRLTRSAPVSPAALQHTSMAAFSETNREFGLSLVKLVGGFSTGWAVD